LKHPAESALKPDWQEETACLQQGYTLVAGVDEVGRGCLAGPVVASAVIMPHNATADWYSDIKDSKLLSPKQRERLAPLIQRQAVSIGTGVVSSQLIDRLGMTAAVRLAMFLAVRQLKPGPQYVLIDYLSVPQLSCPQKGITDGDSLCFSIACASIVAKVYRDHLMDRLERRYPGYGLSRHKGYGTAEHLAGLRKYGPSSIHRRLFQPVSQLQQLSFDDMLQRRRSR
jgi:ribonuclease HII